MKEKRKRSNVVKSTAREGQGKAGTMRIKEEGGGREAREKRESNRIKNLPPPSQEFCILPNLEKGRNI